MFRCSSCGSVLSDDSAIMQAECGDNGSAPGDMYCSVVCFTTRTNLTRYLHFVKEVSAFITKEVSPDEQGTWRTRPPML